jgi:hypothetical protein
MIQSRGSAYFSLQNGEGRSQSPFDRKKGWFFPHSSRMVQFMFISQILYLYSMCALLQTMQTMGQITIKTPNPKCRLFLKIYLQRDQAAGVNLSEAAWDGKEIL